MSSSALLLSLDGIGKDFPGVTALDEVGFAVCAGEVRALMGENGAGKSTLLKILGGDHAQSRGTIRIDGRDCRFASPRDSQAAGVAIIHQELQLAPNLTVSENLLLGALPARHGFLDRRTMRAKALGIMTRLGEDVDPDTRVGDLSIGKRQMVEIGKALLRDAKIIAFDEPTSSLSARETATLKRIIAELRAEGRAILYVSHRMEEVFEISDSVTVLRDGRHVADFADATSLTSDTLIEVMAGRTIADIYDYKTRTLGPVSLGIDAVEGPGLSMPVSFSVQSGEILGLFGLIGAGRSELLKLLFGATPLDAGAISIEGKTRSRGTPRSAIAAGMAFCPEDRKGEGIIPLNSVAENIALARRNVAGGSIAVHPQAELREAMSLIDLMRVKTASPRTAITTLSGGNQQKAVIARWLAADARIFLMDEPTRGIDVSARSEIYAHMYRLAEEGRTIICVSSDLPEVMGIADRILVMREGAIAGIVGRGEATPEQLLRLAFPKPSLREGSLSQDIQ